MAGRKILLVEGDDDLHVMRHICGNRNIPNLDEISPVGDVTRLLENIPIRVRASEEGDVFGIVIDADDHPDGRWGAVRGRFLQAGYSAAVVPAQSVETGTILETPAEGRLPRFGIWVMPNNQTKGILENFLEFLVPESDVLLDYAKNCVSNLPKRPFIDNDEPKALIHTWLAWQKEPGKPYGTAITAKFLDPNVAQADILVNWLRMLFFPDA